MFEQLIYLTASQLNQIVCLGLAGTFAIAFLLGWYGGKYRGYFQGIRDARIHGQKFVETEYQNYKERQLEGY